MKQLRVDKWEIFAQLRKGHSSFGIGYRTLAVLNALLSFLPSRNLSQSNLLVVFPSNRSLCERAHGMPESTLRRHLAALLESGLIRRHDSPNGKRYAARNGNGDLIHAFGLDLAPLLALSHNIAEAARAAEEATEAHRRLRERFTLMKRDAIKLSEYATRMQIPGDWDRIAQALTDLHRRGRRKLTLPLLQTLVDETADLLNCITSQVGISTEEMSANDGQNERHLQSSKEEYLESGNSEEAERPSTISVPSILPDDTSVPLEAVLDSCSEARSYASEPIRSWRDLNDLAHTLHQFLGITTSAWQEALSMLGPRCASITLFCIMERLEHIQSPGGYLRALCRKAAAGRFSVMRMVAALGGNMRTHARVDSCQLS